MHVIVHLLENCQENNLYIFLNSQVDQNVKEVSEVDIMLSHHHWMGSFELHLGPSVILAAFEVIVLCHVLSEVFYGHYGGYPAFA